MMPSLQLRILSTRKTPEWPRSVNHSGNSEKADSSPAIAAAPAREDDSGFMLPAYRREAGCATKFLEFSLAPSAGELTRKMRQIDFLAAKQNQGGLTLH